MPTLTVIGNSHCSVEMEARFLQKKYYLDKYLFNSVECGDYFCKTVRQVKYERRPCRNDSCGWNSFAVSTGQFINITTTNIHALYFNKKSMKKYVLVTWPYSQLFMDHPCFNECYLVQAFEYQQHYDAAYFVPEDLYEELKSEIND